MSGRVRALDGVRGVAVLAVLLFHVGALPIGWLGVPVFFALSGYLITRQLNAGLPVSIFWARRARSLVPPLFAYLALNAAICIAQGRDLTAYIWHFLFLSDQVIARGFANNHGHVWHLWSIAVEIQAYAIWPLVARHRVALSLIAVIGLAYWITATPMTLAGSVGFFALGGLLSRYEAPEWNAPAWLTSIGAAGYSIYLWQLMCIGSCNRMGLGWAGIPLSLGVGILLHRSIWNRPVMDLLPATFASPAMLKRRNPPLFATATVLPDVSPCLTTSPKVSP